MSAKRIAATLAIATACAGCAPTIHFKPADGGPVTPQVQTAYAQANYACQLAVGQVAAQRPPEPAAFAGPQNNPFAMSTPNIAGPINNAMADRQLYTSCMAARGFVVDQR